MTVIVIVVVVGDGGGDGDVGSDVDGGYGGEGGDGEGGDGVPLLVEIFPIQICSANCLPCQDGRLAQHRGESLLWSGGVRPEPLLRLLAAEVHG